MTLEILILLIAFQIKHFLCDYPLQSQYHLRKSDEKKWILPLISHCYYHMIYTTLIIAGYSFYEAFANIKDEKITILLLPIADFIIHFIMDTLKSRPSLLGRYKMPSKGFWNSLGFDQLIHHLTGIFIIFYLVNGGWK